MLEVYVLSMTVYVLGSSSFARIYSRSPVGYHHCFYLLVRGRYPHGFYQCYSDNFEVFFSRIYARFVRFFHPCVFITFSMPVTAFWYVPGFQVPTCVITRVLSVFLYYRRSFSHGSTSDFSVATPVVYHNPDDAYKVFFSIFKGFEFARVY